MSPYPSNRPQFYDSGLRSTDAERFGFNGQERTDEIAGTGNHNTALYWEYDTRLGRRWNLDPKPIESVSSYAVITNNPILMNDPFGDTTYIYNTKGIYVGVILDQLTSNEIVFMTDITAKAIMKIDGSGKRTHEQVAKVARNPNFAYARLTENTRRQLLDMRQKHGNPERMGLLWINSITKELQAWECPECGVYDFTAEESKMFNENGFAGKDQVKGTILFKWHTHLGETNREANPTQDQFAANERDYPWIRYYLGNMLGADGVAGLILSDKTLTIFHMKENDKYFQGKEDFKKYRLKSGGQIKLD